MHRDPKTFRERFKAWKNGLLVYDNGRPTELPEYEGGRDEQNWYDEFVEQHPTVSTAASFLPIVGTAMDVYDAYKDPSAKNIGYAALSVATDLIGGRLITKLGGQAIKNHKRFKKVFNAAKKEYSSWEYYKNMNPADAKRYIREAAKQKATDVVGVEDFPGLFKRAVTPVMVYTPDAIANINLHKKDSVGYSDGKDEDNITTLREITVTPNESYAMASSDDMRRDLQYNIARAKYKNNLDAYNLLRNMNAAQEGVAMNFGLPLVMGLAGSPLDVGVEGAINLGKAGLNLLKSKGSALRQIGANATQDYALAGGGKRFTLMLYDTYLRGHDVPYLYVKPRINKSATIGTTKAFKNSIEPRLRAMRPWMSKDDIKNAVDATLDQGYSVYDKSIFDKAGIEENTVGSYFPSTDHIAVKEGYEKFASNHEFRHRLDNRLPLVEAEESLLSKSFTDDFIKLSEEVEQLKGVDLSLEMSTVNRDAVEELLGTEAYNTVPVRKQKQLIKSASDDEIVVAMENSNGYGRAYVEKLRRKYGKVPKSLINAWRKSYQQVGVGAGIAVLNSKSKK